MKIARQGEAATKSGNGLPKTSKHTRSDGRFTIFLFSYFSVVLVVKGRKSLTGQGFPLQPARQQDDNRLCNKPCLSERHLDLLRNLYKAVRDFCG